MNDSISRQAAIKALWKALHEYEDKTEKQFQESEDLDVEDWMLHRIFVQKMSDIDRQTILNLPSAQLEYKELSDWKADFKEYIDALDIPRDDYNGIMEYIDEMPTAQPKMGEWLRTDDMYETLICSICDYDTQDYIDYPYCPNCGAKMKI